MEQYFHGCNARSQNQQSEVHEYLRPLPHLGRPKLFVQIKSISNLIYAKEIYLPMGGLKKLKKESF